MRTVLDIVHVLAGAAYTARLTVGGPALNRDRRGEIVQAEDSSLRTSVSTHTMGGANVYDEWWQEFRDADGIRLSQGIGTALEAISEAREPQLLAGRFLDACAWYGDGAREPSPAAAIVKYLTAMERLLWTGEKGRGVTERVSARAAALCFSTAKWNFDDLVREVRDAYDVRSGIVHGRIGPSSAQVRKSGRLCERVSRRLIQTWLHRYASEFGSKVDLTQLQQHLDTLAHDARAASKSARMREESR